jgi:hypothetical protein
MYRMKEHSPRRLDISLESNKNQVGTAVSFIFCNIISTLYLYGLWGNQSRFRNSSA